MGQVKLTEIKESDIARAWALIAEKKPLVYHITNGVAMAMQANVTLAVGASPLMSQYPDEAEELAAIADGLLINLGTPSVSGIRSAQSALELADVRGKFTLFDPVGYGASKIRTEGFLEILDIHKYSVIKGNAGEMSLLAGMGGKTRGVDSEAGDSVAEAVKKTAQKYKCIACATGETDFISDGSEIIEVTGGSFILPSISGSGCTVGSVMLAAICACGDAALGALTGLVAMGIASEHAEANSFGPGTFVPCLIDELNDLEDDDFIESSLRWKALQA